MESLKVTRCLNRNPIWYIFKKIYNKYSAWFDWTTFSFSDISGRAPALLDSIDQAFLTAPLFVLMEVAFFFGYRRDFYDEIMLEVEANIKKFNASKEKKNE